jgi:putative membrane protein
MKKICLASLAVAAMLATGCNKHDTAKANHDAAAGTSGRNESVSAGDRDFVKDVSSMNAAEIDLSRVAVDKASTPDVKKFAQMMVDEHTAAGDKLSGVAVQNSIDAPATADDSHRDSHDKLAGKQGLDFDRGYIDQMIDDHQKLVDKLESRIDRDTVSKYKASADSQATDQKAKVEVKTQTVLPEKSDDVVTQRINAWAADTYPAAYAHLQSAKALRDQLKKSATH